MQYEIGQKVIVNPKIAEINSDNIVIDVNQRLIWISKVILDANYEVGAIVPVKATIVSISSNESLAVDVNSSIAYIKQSHIVGLHFTDPKLLQFQLNVKTAEMEILQKQIDILQKQIDILQK